MEKYSSFVLHLEFLCKCKRGIKKSEGVSVQNWCPALLWENFDLLEFKIWLILKSSLIRLMLWKKHTNYYIVSSFFSDLKSALKEVRLSSCRADALNYCNRFLIRSHLNFDQILAVIFYVEILKVHKCRFENFTTCSGSYKNNTLKISHS